MWKVMISQQTLAYSLVYMQWDSIMPLENLKNTSHHIHIFIIKIVYHLTHLANFFPVLKLQSFFFHSTFLERTRSKTFCKIFSKFSTSFSRTPIYSFYSIRTNNTVEILTISRSFLIKGILLCFDRIKKLILV